MNHCHQLCLSQIFTHLIVAAAQLFRLGGVRRVDGSLLVNDAVVTVAGSYYLQQPLVYRAQRVHTYRHEQKYCLHLDTVSFDERYTCFSSKPNNHHPTIIQYFFLTFKLLLILDFRSFSAGHTQNILLVHLFFLN